MRKNKRHILLLLFLLLNLLISVNLSHAATTTLGSVSIGECAVDCLILTTPTQLSVEANAAQFISNQPKNIYFYSNYDDGLGEKVRVSNATENGFTLSVESAPSINTVHPDSIIPYSQIGIASFNNGIADPNASLDSARLMTTTPIDSLIDPVIKTKLSPNPILEPFDQATLQDLIDNNDLHLPEYYTYFSGANANSDSIQIIDAPDDKNSMGGFDFGLSAIIKISANSINAGLAEGAYKSTLTFTLTSK